MKVLINSCRPTQTISKSIGQYESKAYAAAGHTSSLALTTIKRLEPGRDDVQIEILYFGICHSAFIKSVTSGVQCPLFILVFLDMKLLVVLQR